jgi:hypothetical protein
MKNSPRSSAGTPDTGSPLAWQQAVGRRLGAVLAQSRAAHAPAHDTAPPADEAGFTSRWRLDAPARTATPAIRALARLQAPDPAGRAAAGALLARCLAHYRTQIRPDDTDDAGVAFACFLAACVQAQEGQAVSPERWRAVHAWIEAWVADALDWDAAPAEQQQDFFDRMACLAVAIGEWSVVASRQGEAAMRTAQLLARSALSSQLGVELGALAAALRHLPGAARAAADPSWGDAELPKAPTTPEPGQRL